MLKNRAPAIAKVLKGEDIGPPTMDVNLMCKDMRAMITEGQSLGRKMPLTSQALSIFEAAVADGMGEKDAIKIPAYWLSRPAPA